MPLLPDGPLPEGAAHGGPEAIAIVGLSFQFPGGCDTPDAFWQALLERRSTSTEAPEARYSASSLWHPDASRRGTVALRGGHFLAHDISRFDAPFFSISDTEAAALDPQQRGLLETTFRALENGRSHAWLTRVRMHANITHSSGTRPGSGGRVQNLRLHGLLYR